ncbi:MAG TPA: M56 family metallopeptidase [Egicoccus sp.]|nr:M56 family metallopeptidase [Egicoccus sp.]HSK24108.1 M56 family metallopeptidase [Egicoccus sp.]
MDLGVLLALPLESVAVRAILATLGSMILVRTLLRVGLRAPSVRVATALAPGTAVVGVLVLTWGSLHLPSLMLPVEAAGALPIPVRDGYLHFAPIAAPLLVGVWASVAAVRLWRRGRRFRSARLHALLARREGTASPALQAVTDRLAAQLRVPAPAVAVLPSCPGGALVVGTRHPVVLIGRDLMAQLDDAELEGVLAHELAHVRRRDNLVSGVLGALRDLTFFVPGGGWAVRQLHRERELAADQVAVKVTQRPGALASGLLKVVEAGPRPSHPCAALAPGGSLVDRVRILVDDAPPVTARRRGVEAVAVTGTVMVAMSAALVVPTALTGADHQRDAVAVVWSARTPSVAGDTAGEVARPARAFSVYRRNNLDVAQPEAGGYAQLDERSYENRPSTLRSCAAEDGTCPAPQRRVGLGLQPRPDIRVDHELTSRWQDATPVMSGRSGDGFGVYVLSRADDEALVGAVAAE